MNILILSCNTGGGHNAAAHAIERELLARGDSCTIRNALDFTPAIKQGITEGGHSVLYKWAPDFYGEQYEKMERKKSHLMLYLDYARFCPQITVYVNENHFDAVICVHAFPAMMLSAGKRLFGSIKAKLYFVATDYSVAPGLEKTKMDAIFVPFGCRRMFRDKLPKANIVETGIPIDSRYYEDISKEVARKELGIRNDVKLVVISAGSIGCGPIEQIANRIKDDTGNDTCVAVLCGNNKKLHEELSVRTMDAHFLAIGFTDKALYWTKAADVVISKAGGLSITEIASAGVPLVCMNAVPGLELRNLETMVDWGCAVTANRTDEVCGLAEDLCHNEKERNRIINNQSKHFAVNAVEKLVDYVIGAKVI